MATFWDKIKFSKKPFNEGKKDAAPDAAADSKSKKPAPKKTKPAAETKTDRQATAFSHVLTRPHLSEKAVMLAEHGTYVFEVSVRTNAAEVSKAILAIYGIVPDRVRLMNVRSRTVRFGRTQGQTRAWKKALVTLPKGKKLDIYG